jgi:hypothetical protein
MRWNKFRQIFISYRRMPFNFSSDARPCAALNSLLSKLVTSSYEMNKFRQIFILQILARSPENEP